MRFLKVAARRLRFRCSTAGLLSSWTLISKVVLLCIGITALQNNLYGLLQCRFSISRRKFVFSKPMAIYCLGVATLFGLYYGNHIWNEFQNGQFAQLDAIKIYCYVNTIAVLLNYVTQWAIMGDIERFLNILPLFSTINFFNVPFISISRSLIVAVLKMFGFPLLMQVTLMLYQKQEHLSPIMIMIPIVLGNQLNNCFFGAIVIAQALFMQINNLLREMLCEVNSLQTPVGMSLHKPFYRMQRFCDLADRLDKLASKYTLIANFSREYLVLTSFSLVMSLAINLFSTTYGCYMQYHALADYIISEEAYDVSRALAHFVFLLVPFLEIFLVARITQQELNEAKEAGNVLQRMNLEHADVRFKKVVETFWMEICTINLKLMPMGLLELDGSMVNKLYSTVAGFLLFLIQNDLNLRFSIK